MLLGETGDGWSMKTGNYGHKGLNAKKRQALIQNGKASRWMPLRKVEDALNVAGL